MGIYPALLTAGEKGKIRPHPSLLMAVAKGEKWGAPEDGELIPLPPESELFLLPGRHAAGIDAASGKIENARETPVAAFISPGHTISAHPAFFQDDKAPLLPLFAYGAVGFARGKYWVCARKVDDDPRQRFAGIKHEKIEKNCRQLLRQYPHNRLVGHIINNCVRRYACPAARNFALGRHEAPLPSSQSCNSRCLGCISAQDASSPIVQTPQCRIAFTPSVSELAEVMRIHEEREKKCPIYSFGQGCEGDPLVNAPLLSESVEKFRAMRKGGFGRGTVNCNTNASNPVGLAMLAEAGLTSMRASLNSARPDYYEAYYRPKNYNFSHVRQSLRLARLKGIFVSLNLLFFPGITDTAEELEALAELCARDGVSMIQWRNLNIDPRWHALEMEKNLGKSPFSSPPMGLALFMKKLSARCPWLRHGYFNPFLGDKADIIAPMPS